MTSCKNWQTSGAAPFASLPRRDEVAAPAVDSEEARILAMLRSDEPQHIETLDRAYRQ